jgi:hypothetical protein
VRGVSIKAPLPVGERVLVTTGIKLLLILVDVVPVPDEEVTGEVDEWRRFQMNVDEVVEEGLGALRDTGSEQTRFLLEALNGLDIALALVLG